MVNFNKILKAYKEELIGKDFIYKSKYGSMTRGTVDSIFITNSIEFDPETTRKLEIVLSRTEKGKNIKVSHEPIDTKEWTATRPEVMIKSTTGNVYSLQDDEIYFIDGKNTKVTE